MLVKIQLIKDVTLLLRKAHWIHIRSTVFSSLFFQVDLVELEMVQKMATETIWGNNSYEERLKSLVLFSLEKD